MEDRGLAEQGPHERAGRLGVVGRGDADGREPAQRHPQRQVGHGAVGGDEPPQRGGRQRIEVLDRPGLGGNQGRGELLAADADPDGAEVVVVGAALPQPLGRRHRPERVRGRAAPLLAVALGLRDPPDPVAAAGEVAQELPALLLHLPPVLRAGRQQRPDHHGQRRDQEERTRHVGDRVGRAGQQVGDRTQPGQCRQGGEPEVLHAAAGQLGRRLELDVVRGHRRARRPGRPTEPQRRHVSPDPDSARLPGATTPWGHDSLGPRAGRNLPDRVTDEERVGDAG